MVNVVLLKKGEVFQEGVGHHEARDENDWNAGKIFQDPSKFLFPKPPLHCFWITRVNFYFEVNFHLILGSFSIFFLNKRRKYICRKVLDEEIEPPITDLTILQKYARDILNGIVPLHRKNIIHGDLKPVNLLELRSSEW